MTGTDQSLMADKKQIGLTASGNRSLERLMSEGLFAAEGDAYKFGIAYAIATGLTPDQAPDGGYGTKFNAAGGLDREGLIRDLLAVLAVGDASRPYATAERLAEIGLAALAKRVEAHESLAEILAELAEQADGPEAQAQEGVAETAAGSEGQAEDGATATATGPEGQAEEGVAEPEVDVAEPDEMAAERPTS